MPSPNNYQGLSLWWDAADPSTINDGRVIANQNVYKITDKVNGVTLTNGSGVLGPTYAIGAVNGYNAIHMPHYATTEMGLKALSNSNVTVPMTSTSKTLVFVHRPTTNTSTSGRYAFSLWGNGRTIGGTFPSIWLFGNHPNPYSQYGEAPTNPNNNTRSLNNWSNKSFEFGALTGQQIDLGATQIFIVRTKPGISKFNFIQQRGFDTRTLYYTDTLTTGTPASLGSPAKIVVGSYNDAISGAIGVGIKTTNGNPLEGFFCEMMYYNRYLSTSEVNSLEQYLKMKWIG